MCSDYDNYSQCIPVDQNTWQCLCPKTGFTVRDKKPLGRSMNGTELFIETCADIDECAEGMCSGPQMICLNTVGSYDCRCNDTFKFNNTKTECIPVCTDVQCNYGKCLPTGKSDYWCYCEDGYSGRDCSTKAEG